MICRPPIVNNAYIDTCHSSPSLSSLFLAYISLSISVLLMLLLSSVLPSVLIFVYVYLFISLLSFYLFFLSTSSILPYISVYLSRIYLCVPSFSSLDLAYHFSLCQFTCVASLFLSRFFRLSTSAISLFIPPPSVSVSPSSTASPSLYLCPLLSSVLFPTPSLSHDQ